MIHPRSIGLLLFMVTACGTPDQERLLKRYLTQDLGLKEGQFPSAIFVVTEDGCPSCDRAFADLVRTRTSARGCLFLVRAEGRSVNLNGFLEETAQIRFDNDGSFKELGLLKASGVILLKNNQVDTIISLRAAEIQHQLASLVVLLDSLSLGSAR